MFKCVEIELRCPMRLSHWIKPTPLKYFKNIVVIIWIPNFRRKNPPEIDIEECVERVQVLRDRFDKIKYMY